MTKISFERISRRGVLAGGGAVAAGLAAGKSFAQAGWKPTGPVEFVVPGDAGSVGDTRARQLEQIWRTHKLVDVPIVVVNKGGGGHSIYANYLINRQPGQALGITLGALLSAHIMKNHDVDYRQMTPIAYLGNEYYVWVVKADSKIKSGQDLFERMRKDPQSLVVGVSNPGGPAHIQILSVLHDQGVDLSKLKIVTFAGGGETRTALLGGHIDFTATSASNMVAQQQAGQVRGIAANASSRLPAPYADVPTLEEVGAKPQWYLNSWTVISAPKNTTPEQVAYWENVFAETMKTPEWIADAKKALRDLEFKNSKQTAEFLAQEYDATKKMIGETIGIPN